MSEALSIAVSGMKDAATRVLNSASNIVNVSSTTVDGKNFTPSTVVSESVSVDGNNLGVTSKIVPGAEGTEVDLATEIVNVKVASILYSADAAVIKTVDEMEKKLLDTLA